MSFHWCDSNIHTTVFTPRDHQVELLATAFERNTLICLGHKSSKEFIAMKLLQEMYRQSGDSDKCFLYLTRAPGCNTIYTMLTHLTGLTVYQQPADVATLESLPPNYLVYIVTPNSVSNALKAKQLSLAQVQLVVLEDCHHNDMHSKILPIFKEYYDFKAPITMPKVLGLAGPIHSAECGLEELATMLGAMEASLNSRLETASDIVTVLRYCAKPQEFIIQCAPYKMNELSALIEDLICTRIAFLRDHRYDPSEIYNTDEFLEELKEIPDPKKEPLELLNRLLSVLHEMGPWATDRLAVFMYYYLENQKIKTPHERHYILLCMVSTVLSEIRSLCEQAFRLIPNRLQLIEYYSSPKVLKLLHVLRQFKPEEFASNHSTMNKINNQLEELDFQRLSRSLDQTCHNVENILGRQQLESRSIVENLDPIIKTSFNESIHIGRRPGSGAAPLAVDRHSKPPSNANHRRPYTRRRMPFTRRGHRSYHDSAETLCGLIFCNNDYTARVLFDLLCEMSRADPSLKNIKCQYTMDRVADPLKEPKEAEKEHRRQEDVLKRFRMHECNLLITTPVLEEGIDVPKCNLVVRWDPPSTYRSYVQCKGRARAVPAYHVILVAPKFQLSPEQLLTHKVTLNEHSHRMICVQKGETNGVDHDSEATEDSDESSEEPSSKSGQFTIASSRGTVKILNPEIITDKPPTTTELKTADTDAMSTLEEATGKLSLTEIKETTDKVEGDTSVDSDLLESSLDERLGIGVKSLEEVLAESEQNTPEKPAKPKKKAPSCMVKSPPTDEAPRKFHAVFESGLSEMDNTTSTIIQQLAQYREIEKLLLQKCANTEPYDGEHHEADRYTRCVQPYKPVPHLLTSASVDLSTSIALINKYCSKLPSDTFTKLTALWRNASTVRNGQVAYQCTLRLPINSPLKYDIVGLPMSTQVLARRMVALQACIELHKMGELDHNLQPIGKEGFRAIEPDWETFELEEQDERRVSENCEPRPGTTKRRQYYYKRIASEFCNCRPTANTACYLYYLDLTLQCPIPEEQNTRGRRIYPPEEAQQGFGILTLVKIPKVSSFPIFTRSGEVKVAIQLAKQEIRLTDEQIRCINTFVNYTFTNVLRLQKFLMLFDPESTENCVFIVPTIRRADNTKVIDWDFLRLIEQQATMMPTPVPEEERKLVQFDAKRFKDAVVMPWYRNQDQPQYFYVAEICPHLSPLSCFPGENYRTFKHYYYLKYQLNIQDSAQPLLDVDHTSARLNFLTPRYVNRKGVALPTSSEETKRAKRENLEQKQILVPELCTVHPFPASLWRTAVCLPCILYRLNGLLLADDIRKKVSMDIGLGTQSVRDDFEWPMLDFGWSLSEVLRKSKESKAPVEVAAAESTSQKAKPNDSKAASKKDDENPTEKEDNKDKVEKSANEIVIEGEKKLHESSLIEIGTWTNEMANNIDESTNNGDADEDDEFLDYLPSNVKFCDREMRYGSPTFWDMDEVNTPANRDPSAPTANSKAKVNKNNAKSASFAYYDSDDSLDSTFEAGPRVATYYSSDDEDYDVDVSHFAFTSKNEAETIETQEELEKRQKQLSIIQETNANERNYQETKNLQVGYNYQVVRVEIPDVLTEAMARYYESIERMKESIRNSDMLVKCDQNMELPKKGEAPVVVVQEPEDIHSLEETIQKMLPYVNLPILREILARAEALTVDDIKKLNTAYVLFHPDEQFTILGAGSVFDNFNDYDRMQCLTNGACSVQFTIRLKFEDPREYSVSPLGENARHSAASLDSSLTSINNFSFDHQPDLVDHPGPSPSIILQGLTMSNANDGINLERLETIGDSFLKYAITTYLYITYDNVHEGKLSHLRSKQVANLNLYRLGRRKMLGEYMIATKFEPHDNWLPPCYYVPKELEKALIEAKIPPHHWKLVDLQNIKKLSSAEICSLVKEKADSLGLSESETNASNDEGLDESDEAKVDNTDFSCFIPYNLVTQHSIPDKSVADCVEALIGAYLIECGSRGALLFMAWLGIRVLPYTRKQYDPQERRVPGSTLPDADNMVTVYGEWAAPKSPLLLYSPNAGEELEAMLKGFDEFEHTLGYRFRDRSYLLQAMTHASYSPNRLTDCYQRLEFLGDAVLDYLITRHLYEDPRQHSPGALTDLRSALVNNTIFASLAVRHGFHKYFRHLSPGLNDVIDRFVRIQNENGHSISEEFYLLSEDECDDAEDVEVPKALGDVFESIAGAIFLDSNMSLDVVWKVYSNMMKPEIEQFSNSVPKSPIRELLELEPETAKFGKPEKLADGRRVRVTVDVFCKGVFRGIGRNYRIAKCTAAKCALRQLKKQGLIAKKD